MIVFFVHFLFFWSSVFFTTRYESKKASLTKTNMLPLVLFNQLPILLISYNFESYLPIFYYRNMVNYIWKFPLMILIMNFFFSLFHYIAHKKRYLYKNIHYIHHRLIISDGMGAIYAHPLEQLFINILPILLAVFICNSDFILTCFYVANISWGTVQGHHNYKNSKTTRHSMHHYHKIINYDNYPYLLDKFIGSYK